jgi:hypothetical protein
MLRLMELSEALELNDADTNRLRETLDRFDAQRQPLHQEVTANIQVLRRAANGDATAFGQVDQATSRVTELRGQIQQLDRELLQSLTKGVDPQRKARVVLTLNRLPGEIKELTKGARQGLGGGARGGARPRWGTED